MDLGLKDRVAIVAASSTGLGKAVAMGLAREGAKLALCARTAQTLDETADEIRGETGVDVFARATDVTIAARSTLSWRRRTSTSAAWISAWPTAGGPPSKSFAETTVEDWRTVGESEFDEHGLSGEGDAAADAGAPLGPLHRHHFGDGETAGGWLDSFQFGPRRRSGLIKTLANEYGPYNVLVNNVCPGFTATARLMDLSRRWRRSRA